MTRSLYWMGARAFNKQGNEKRNKDVSFEMRLYECRQKYTIEQGKASGKWL
jgi:hypothetical protein